jgi:hypothetical protein
MRRMQWHRLSHGKAASPDRPQDLSRAVQEMRRQGPHGRGRQLSPSMRGYTTKEKLRITAGAAASLVIVGWIVVLAIVVLSAG